MGLFGEMFLIQKLEMYVVPDKKDAQPKYISTKGSSKEGKQQRQKAPIPI